MTLTLQRREQLSETHFPISGLARYGAMCLILLLVSPMLVHAQTEYTFNPSNMAWIFFIDEGETKNVVFEIKNLGSETLDISMSWPPELSGLEIIPMSSSILPHKSKTFSLGYIAPSGFEGVRQFLHIQVNGNLETFLIDAQPRGDIAEEVLSEDILIFGRNIDFGGGIKLPAWLILVGAFFITLYLLTNVKFTTGKKSTRKRKSTKKRGKKK